MAINLLSTSALRRRLLTAQAQPPYEQPRAARSPGPLPRDAPDEGGNQEVIKGDQEESRGPLPRDAPDEGGNQMQSDAIRCNQMQSDAIRCNQMASSELTLASKA